MQFEPNKIIVDDFGRPHGMLLIDKPVGITSHDVVDVVRRALSTSKVGHAGALDPFASGLLIVLVGKATKLSDSFLNLDKSYLADVLFGVETDSADPEGEVVSQASEVSLLGLDETLKKFMPEYLQAVSVFSSVKVDGQKLRILARQYPKFQLLSSGNEKHVQFLDESGQVKKEVNLPIHRCKIYALDKISETQVDATQLAFVKEPQSPTYPLVKINVSCSKGTYIRVLASDIGAALPTPTPAMLIGLQRTQIGDYTLSAAWTLAQLREAYPSRQARLDAALG